jgi:hypothetical protein
MNGSLVLQRYLTLRYVDGLSPADAAFEAGMNEAEALLTDTAVERGELEVPPPAVVTNVLPFGPTRSAEPEPEAEPAAPSRLLGALAAARTHLPVHQKEKTMSRKAKAKADEIEEVPQPDFTRAAKILRNDVAPAEEKSAKTRGDLSAAWKVIQDECHVNKKAAKLIHWMRTQSDELKDDFLRSLYGLMKELKLGISADLVDKMGDGEAPEMPIVAARAVGTETLASLNS